MFAMLAFFWLAPVRAAVLGFESGEVVFGNQQAPTGTTWSPNLSLGEEGLHSPVVEENRRLEVWIQTVKMPVGAAWRPPTSARIGFSLHGEAKSSRPLDAYVRYSIDGVHWSTWHRLPPANRPKAGALWAYALDLQLPAVVRKRYHELMRAWWKTDPVWMSDEDAFCRWLAKNHPGFFATDIPFLGWVQFRLEGLGLDGQLNIRKLRAEFSWGTGGLHTPPKDGKYPAAAKWHFEIGAE
jgi:hypothetical protein